MVTKIFSVLAAAMLAMSLASVAFADAAPNGNNCLGVERSSRSGDGGWGPGISYDARFGGTDIYGQYIVEWKATYCY